MKWISRFFVNWIIFWIESWLKQYWIEYWMNHFLAKFKHWIESDWVSPTTKLNPQVWQHWERVKLHSIGFKEGWSRQDLGSTKISGIIFIFWLHSHPGWRTWLDFILPRWILGEMHQTWICLNILRRKPPKKKIYKIHISQNQMFLGYFWLPWLYWGQNHQERTSISMFLCSFCWQLSQCEAF